ncbi:MAG: RNA polymerase sigma factor [Planctomycetes bacterium]|nr:RNA polymerase sigma factor [Planctomycetota bacterium]
MSNNSNPDGLKTDLGVELMVDIAKGDQHAFQLLVENYQAMVFGLLRRILGPHGAIEDVAQEAFVRVWKNREKYRAQGKFSTFLYRITYNLALNRIRDEKRKPLPGMPKLDGIEIAQQDLCSDTPEEIASRGDWAGLISWGLGRLPHNQRAVLVFQHYDGFSMEEISSVTGLSSAAVKSMLHRARTNLREILQPYKDSEND